MNWLYQQWRSLLDSLTGFFSLLELFAQGKIGRFILGSIGGMFFAAILWAYTIFFYVNISFLQGIIGSLLIMLVFGTVAAYGDLDRFLESFDLTL